MLINIFQLGKEKVCMMNIPAAMSEKEENTVYCQVVLPQLIGELFSSQKKEQSK